MSKNKPEFRWRISVRRRKTGAGIETDCTRCMSCEAICSFMHERMVVPEKSRIRVDVKELEWIEGRSNKIVDHIVCQQCFGFTPCMKACPVEGAIKRDTELGTILIDDSRCSRCGECVNACPFKAIWYDQQNDKIIKCDLCGGEPQCVEWCPVSVLEFIKEERKMSRE